MIRKIGVIYQDKNSLGLLKGLKTRLNCEAELVGPPTNVGATQYLTRKTAKIAYAHFQKKGVDLIVRFTDADNAGWQKVKRGELKTFADATEAMIVCGVAVNNTEQWLNLMRDHLAEKLGIPAAELAVSSDPTGMIKHAIDRIQRNSENASEVVARIVSEAPRDAFREMLTQDDSFRAFYSECRAAASRADCHVPNELSEEPSGD